MKSIPIYKTMKVVDVSLDDIVVGETFRKDMGDIDGLAKSILELGLLQPIGITPDNRLVFGSRRIAAHRELGSTSIVARIVELDGIVRGTFAENEMRKAFTPSERVAIAKAVELEIGNRMGRPRTDEKSLSDRTDLIPKGTTTRDVAARRVGASTGDLSRTGIVMETGAPELIAAMDSNVIAVEPAYFLARHLTHDEQREVLQMSSMDRKKVIADLRTRPIRKDSPDKQTKPGKAPKKPPIERPTYWPALTFDEQGFPPRETWNEPDPENPAQTRVQAHIAKHGHVHIMPLHVRQAQDRLIAARRLNSQVRELVKPLTAFLASEPAPIELADLTRALGEMPDADKQTVHRRLTAILADTMPLLTRACDYLAAVGELINARLVEQSGHEEQATASATTH